ncbi:carbohydrate kinase [Devosia rhodophyticola]|uniref:Carbohydrate kinase n=1 Tax=Devosia rhodophyticola TaxID=3026423 RepID=A0ABY7YVE3_9HYPH|nr:carbohydrate kinase [Devosia rhodophyticola]WDR04830.1 carbohydrate kinase [Devosia rhodophyticola]
MFVVGGESLIDLVSAPRGADGSIHMQAHQGGSPYNCAIALSRLGNDTGYLCPISKDGFGSYLLEPLEAAGVRQLLRGRVNVPTTLAVVTLDAQGKAQYEFYRGADRAIESGLLTAALPDDLELYQIGGFCPILPDDAEKWLVAVEAAIARGATISIDPNVRPSLVEDFDGYKERLGRFLDLAHVIKVSEEDLQALDPSQSIEAHAQDLLARPNCELVVVTLGEHGSRAFTSNGWATAGVYTPPQFGDTVGAGDSLMAGVLTQLGALKALKPGALKQLDDAALMTVLRFGAVVAGLNCGQKGCNPPTRAQVEALLGGAEGQISDT